MSDALKKECIRVGSDAATKQELLSEISRLAKKSDLLKEFSEDLINTALSEREGLSSTGLARGIAIPHCAFDGLNEFVAGLIVIPEGIDFDAIDKSKSRLIFFLVSPAEQREKHIRILSSISRLAVDRDLTASLLEAKTPEEVYSLLSDVL